MLIILKIFKFGVFNSDIFIKFAEYSVTKIFIELI